jgi:hypothetical protein
VINAKLRKVAAVLQCCGAAQLKSEDKGERGERSKVGGNI